MVERFRLKSVNRAVGNPEVLQPILRRFTNEYGRDLVHPFAVDRIRINLVRPFLLDSINEFQDVDKAGLRAMVRALMPPSFQQPLHNRQVNRLAISFPGDRRLLYIVFAPDETLRAEQTAAEVLGKLSETVPEFQRKFQLRAPIAEVRVPVSGDFLRHAAGSELPLIDLQRGEVFVRGSYPETAPKAEQGPM